MRHALLLLVMMLCFGNCTQAPSQQVSNGGLRIELHTNATHLRLSDRITLTVILRSPERVVTLWNAFEWGFTPGFRLHVFNSSGKDEGDNFFQGAHPVGPDDKELRDWISIGGNRFAGFDTDVPVTAIFRKPGKYVLKCTYMTVLSRDSVPGATIWGKEDGTIESNETTVFVDK
jgi:hypothetical protein